MDCALWLNRRKIFTAAEISGNLDVASLRGYFLAGTLIGWLNEHGGKRYADKLSGLSPDDKLLNEKIAEIFGAGSLPFKELNGQTAPQAPEISVSALLSSYPIGSAGSYNYEAISSFGSFRNLLTSYSLTSFSESSGGSFEWEQWLSLLSGYGSFSMGSFEFGSYSQWEWLYNLLFGYGSFSSGSFSLGSFYRWEWLYNLLFGYGSFSMGSFEFGSYSQWEWLYNLLFGYGSFSLGSFSFGSFHQWEWEWLYNLLFGYGSFSGGSFEFGSFTQWEWLYNLLFGYGSFSGGSFKFGSFSMESLLRLFKNYGSFTFGSFGMFGSSDAVRQNTGFFLDEYDFIMLKTLADNPLDRYGYGIHNI